MTETTPSRAPECPAVDLGGVVDNNWTWALLEPIGDRLNPILVKETRQALKSRQFTLWFILLLLACWVTTIGAVAIIGPSIYYVSAGPYLLMAYYVILGLPLTVVVPFTAYRSLSSEREENTRDLLEVSTLTSRQVIHGKLGSAAVQIGVYLSALAPCIAFTYLLRGVSILQIALLLVYAVLASIGLSAVGLLLAATARQKHTQVVISVVLAGGLFGAFGGMVSLAVGLLSLDATDLRREEFWWSNLAAFSLYATTLGLVYAAAISLTTFSSANRSTGLRVATTVQTAVYIGWIAGFVSVVSAGIPVEPWLVTFAIAAVYWFLAGALMTGESSTLSLRVRRSLPQSLLGRAVGSWFNPGGGSGYVFATNNLLVCALFAAFGVVATSNAIGLTVKGIGLITAYVIGYLAFGRLAIVGLRRVAEVSGLGGFLIQVLFLLGGTGLPYVVRTFSDRIRIDDLAVVSLPSPAWTVGRLVDGAMDPVMEAGVLIAVGSAATILYLINVAMAGFEARQVRVSAPQRVIEDELELHPEPEAQPTNPWGDLPTAPG